MLKKEKRMKIKNKKIYFSPYENYCVLTVTKKNDEAEKKKEKDEITLLLTKKLSINNII